jgi:hypothetical protein
MKFIGKIDLLSNPALFSFWSLIHIIVAIILWIIVKIIFKNISDVSLFIILFFVHIAYESKDQIVAIDCRRRELAGEVIKNGIGKGCINSVENSIADQICFTLGLTIALLWSKKMNIYQWKVVIPLIIVVIAMMIVSPMMKWG